VQLVKLAVGSAGGLLTGTSLEVVLEKIPRSAAGWTVVGCGAGAAVPIFGSLEEVAPDELVSIGCDVERLLVVDEVSVVLEMPALEPLLVGNVSDVDGGPDAIVVVDETVRADLLAELDGSLLLDVVGCEDGPVVALLLIGDAVVSPPDVKLVVMLPPRAAMLLGMLDADVTERLLGVSCETSLNDRCTWAKVRELEDIAELEALIAVTLLLVGKV
jgi:hypothetical protein